MRINTNISAMNAHRQLSIASSRGASSMERLSSGLRINRAGDDAAGLSISEKMRAQVRGLNQGARNAQDGISLIQTAESALNESHDILQRIRELATQSASGTNTAEDRAAMQGEAAQLKSELDRIGNTTEFNTKTLLNGSLQAAGAGVGLDTTTGATVGRQAAAVLTGTDPMNAADAFAATAAVVSDTPTAPLLPAAFVAAELLTVDGETFSVDWAALGSADEATIIAGTQSDATDVQRTAALDLIVREINEASTVAADVTGSVVGGEFSLTSGTQGSTSGITTSVGNVLGGIFGAQTETGTSAIPGGVAGVQATDFTAETLTVDGVSINVNWQNLTTAQRDTIQVGTATGASAGQMNAAKDLIVNTLNQAINESGQNVAPITGHVSATNRLVLTSGSEGVNSAIQTTQTDRVLGRVMGAAGTTGATGESVYNGLTVAEGTEFFANIGDVQFNVTTSAAITGGTTAMSEAVTTLQTDINSAIDDYNDSAGATAGTPGFIEAVTVNAMADGRFQVISGSGPVSFSDRLGSSAVRDLGLTQAQSEAAGSGGMTLQIGANRGQSMTFGIKDMRTAALGIANVDVSTQAGASNAISSLDGAIRSVSEQRSSLGAAQNRLEHTIRNLDTSKENLQASEARIRDVDMASEMMEFTKNNILQQAATAMLAQANMAPQAVLQLLG